jgi:hypothetical protein
MQNLAPARFSVPQVEQIKRFPRAAVDGCEHIDGQKWLRARC